ncbi:MAG: hypothetical protein ACF8R7_18360 [Phycisphaerales bacterium JB039]
MSVMTRISRMLGPRNLRPSRTRPGPAATTSQRIASSAGVRKPAQTVERKPAPAPVAVGAAANGSGSDGKGQLSDSRVLAATRTKQELLSELQQNYREVVDLVRRVKTHMETQDDRFDRLMQVAEQIRQSVEAAPGLREDARKALAALDQLSVTQRECQDRTENALSAQSGRLNRMTELMESSSETEQRVAATLNDMGTTLSAMAGATQGLGTALQALQEREAKRDAQLAGLLTRSHRWMVAITAMVGVAIAAGLILAAMLAS